MEVLVDFSRWDKTFLTCVRIDDACQQPVKRTREPSFSYFIRLLNLTSKVRTFESISGSRIAALDIRIRASSELCWNYASTKNLEQINNSKVSKLTRTFWTSDEAKGR